MFSVEDGVTWIDEYTGTQRFGVLMNSSYCSVTGRWNLLVAATDGDGKFYGLDTGVHGVAYVKLMTEEAGVDGDEDEDEDEDGSDGE